MSTTNCPVSSSTLADVAGDLQRLREEQDWTMQELATFLGVARPTVSEWLAGVSLPTARRWPALLPRLAPFGIAWSRQELEAARAARRFAKSESHTPLAELLRQAADLSELTTSKLAEEVDAAKHTVERWLVGERLPAPHHLVSLRRALDLAEDELASAVYRTRFTEEPFLRQRWAMVRATVRGWTDSALALELGYARETVAGWAGGSAPVSDASLERVALALGLPIDELDLDALPTTL